MIFLGEGGFIGLLAGVRNSWLSVILIVIPGKKCVLIYEHHFLWVSVFRACDYNFLEDAAIDWR